MTTPYLAEIKIFGGNFAPRGYAQCNGQLLAINTNQALFSILGTQYGGNGTTNFGLPDFRSRAPMHWGQGPGLSAYNVGQQSGTENVTLTTAQLPVHTHQPYGGTTTGSTGQASNTPSAGAVLTDTLPGKAYIATATNLITMAPQMIGNAGGGQAHPNLQPSLALMFIIALQGIYPSRS